jgi:hypothetical protein
MSRDPELNSPSVLVMFAVRLGGRRWGPDSGSGPGGCFGRIRCFSGTNSPLRRPAQREPAGARPPTDGVPGRPGGGAFTVAHRSAGRLPWQDLMQFWHKESVPDRRGRSGRLGSGVTDRARMAGEVAGGGPSRFVLAAVQAFRARARQSADYIGCRGGSDDNDKYSSYPAMLNLPRCVQHGPDAIWY